MKRFRVVLAYYGTKAEPLIVIAENCRDAAKKAIERCPSRGVSIFSCEEIQ